MVTGSKNYEDNVMKNDHIKSPQSNYIYEADEENTSHRKRKLLPPAKRGTISRLVIRKVIKEVMKKRSSL